MRYQVVIGSNDASEMGRGFPWAMEGVSPWLFAEQGRMIQPVSETFDDGEDVSAGAARLGQDEEL
jgi:hypothetical protein